MDSTANSSAMQRPGEILAAERERQGLAPADIAQRLRLSVWQIEALEAGDYARLPRGPFLRGFVRNYAKVLNLPSDGLSAALDEGGPRDPAPRIVVPSQNIRFDPLSERMSSPYVKAAGLSAIVIVIGFAAMYWWLFVRPTPPAAVAHKSSVPEAKPKALAPPSIVATSVPPPAIETATPPQPAPAAAPVVPPKATATNPPAATTEALVTVVPPSTPAAPVKIAPVRAAPANATPVAASPVAASSGSKLKFHFSGRSWVEVRDADGKLLLTGNNPGDTDAEVSGKPPFRVVVGNAPEVQMFFNDRAFDLEPHTSNAVARLTVE
ncbi:MAG: RodZ domain-containing protein [Bacillota bacterium]